MDQAAARELVRQVPHWHHAFEIAPGVETPGSYHPEFVWNKLGLPDCLDGQRALDIGPSDGFYTKKLIEAGADTVAVDYRPKWAHGFWVMERCLDREIEYHHAHIYDIPSLGIGRFDIVLMLGVLYHVSDMLRACSIARLVCRGQLFVETHVDETLGSEPAARYATGKSCMGDLSNFWLPNIACVRALLDDAGFKIERTETWGSRALFACRPVGTTYGKANIVHDVLGSKVIGVA